MIDFTLEPHLRLWQPVEMLRHGKNPYGGLAYRVVFAPSRLILIRCSDGHWRRLPAYRAIGFNWVLEQWRFPEEPREQWQRGVGQTLGPYPERGDYWHCHTFVGDPQDTNIERQIMLIEAGRKVDPTGRLNSLAIKKAYDKETRDCNARVADAIGEKLPAFGLRPFAGAGGSRGTKGGPNLAHRVRSGQRRFDPGKMVNTVPAQPPKRVTLER